MFHACSLSLTVSVSFVLSVQNERMTCPYRTVCITEMCATTLSHRCHDMFAYAITKIFIVRVFPPPTESAKSILKGLYPPDPGYNCGSLPGSKIGRNHFTPHSVQIKKIRCGKICTVFISSVLIGSFPPDHCSEEEIFVLYTCVYAYAIM